MFKASLEPMTEVTNDLHRNTMEMDECIDKLSRISNALKEFPYLEEVSQQISSESQKLEQALSGTVQLERTLYMVQELYRRTDRKVADHCEDVQAAKRMEAVSFHDLSWIVRMVKAKFAGDQKESEHSGRK